MNGTHLRWRVLRWRAVLALILLFVWAIPSASAQNSPRYFAPTGHYLRGAFRSFWERNGGLPIFGYPLTEEYIRRSDQRVIQFFERARFELAVRNNQAIVELAWLGSELTVSQSFPRTPPVPSSGSIRYFPDTGHTLRGAFLTFWNRRGAERIFGQPISEEFQEQLTDGRWHTVQYFQRSRFELWGDVQLGLLGRALAPPHQLAPWPPNSPPAGPLNEDGTPRPPTQQPPPAGAAAVRVEPNSGRAGQTFTVLGEGFDRDERVSLWLTVPGGSVRPIAQKPTADGNGSISGARIQIPTELGLPRRCLVCDGAGARQRSPGDRLVPDRRHRRAWAGTSAGAAQQPAGQHRSTTRCGRAATARSCRWPRRRGLRSHSPPPASTPASASAPG